MPILRDTLTLSLPGIPNDNWQDSDADAIRAWLDYTVKARTQAGQFLPGSSAGAGSYSPGYRAEREKKGLQTTRVDLLVTGQMLDATKGRAATFEDQVRLEYGYLDGLSEAEATRIARYHNDLGAGKSRVIRRLVGLTPS